MVEIDLPIQFFICYGGPSGQRVALKIRYMPVERDLFKPILAEPSARDVISREEFRAEIDKQIVGSQVMVVVGTCDLRKSREAVREINLALEVGTHIIVFLQNGCRDKLPRVLRKAWTPIVYSARSPESSFDKLKLDIISTCLRIANTTIARRESLAQR